MRLFEFDNQLAAAVKSNLLFLKSQVLIFLMQENKHHQALTKAKKVLTQQVQWAMVVLRHHRSQQQELENKWLILHLPN